MSATIETVQETVAKRLTPALDSFEGRLRNARWAITQGQYAVEDLAAGTALQVRRNPLTAVALAGVAGALAGGVCGFLLGWRICRRANRV